jgi:hypothetical protein
VRILLWHVHGTWTDAFVRGRHEYLLPVNDERDADGAGRSGRDWPSTVECPYQTLRELDVDAVVLQRPKELQLAEDWLGRAPGVEVPAVYLEHNTPRGDVPDTRHWVADRADIPLVHVTAYNELLWDAGAAPVTVIEHGVADPGHRYTGRLPRAATIINEPVRRWRVTGTDLIPRFAGTLPVDVFGIGACDLPARLAASAGNGTADRVADGGDLPRPRLHEELASRRCYLHLPRWTSLGLGLIEAMMLGLPPIAVGSTEAYEAVPAGAGVVSTRVPELVAAAGLFAADPALAAETGLRARTAALRRYDLSRFLRDWDRVLEEVTR